VKELIMNDDQMIFVPSSPLEPGDRYGILSGFDPGTRTLEAGFQIAPPFKPLPVDVVFERDVAVTLRDGITIHVDILRPVGPEKVPVIVAWSPYGKGQGTSPSVMGVFGLVGLDNGVVSGLEKFEGPDPAYWCAQGYAICNPDIRGVAESEGDSVLWDRQEGRDCHDLIEWLGVQEWSNGKVGMSGTSYLAVSQWFTAGERPPTWRPSTRGRASATSTVTSPCAAECPTTASQAPCNRTASGGAARRRISSRRPSGTH